MNKMIEIGSPRSVASAENNIDFYVNFEPPKIESNIKKKIGMRKSKSTVKEVSLLVKILPERPKSPKKKGEIKKGLKNLKKKIKSKVSSSGKSIVSGSSKNKSK